MDREKGERTLPTRSARMDRVSRGAQPCHGFRPRGPREGKRILPVGTPAWTAKREESLQECVRRLTTAFPMTSRKV